MDTTAKDIFFDENGICNYCKFYERLVLGLQETQKDQSLLLQNFVKKIKSKGKGKKYDCIIGVSGGVDSSWVLVQAKKLGLKPLAVHLDNGWNSELAQQNIENLVKKLDVDLYTHVINWSEFRDLQESFFDADVIDIELLTDNFLSGLNFRMASKFGVKYILSGSNIVTEGIPMPTNWAAINKYDKKNILNIWKLFGKGYKLNTVTIFSLNNFYYYSKIKGIKWYRFLDLMNYKKSIALEELKSEYGYVPYDYKHYESVFTRFYQGYILPKKFGVDKRKNHLSALIMDGDTSRSTAINLLNEIPYSSREQLVSDKQYFLKKFGWSDEQLKRYLERPEVGHSQYGHDIDILAPLRTLKYFFKGLNKK
jgi:N-acetyl sugar amidotransferase